MRWDPLKIEKCVLNKNYYEVSHMEDKYMENQELVRKLQKRYINQGMDSLSSLRKADEGVRKLTQKKYTKEYFLKKIHEKGYLLQRLCEHIVLRPDDTKKSFGEKGFKNMVEAIEETLETQKNSELYKYYYDMKLNDHDFHDFERWKIWGRKVGS